MKLFVRFLTALGRFFSTEAKPRKPGLTEYQ